LQAFFVGFHAGPVTLATMKVISIRQPWASLIVIGAKDVENRTWPTRYRGPVLIHASQRADDVSSDAIEHRFGLICRKSFPWVASSASPR
jgi:hypothetical protein